MTLFVVGFAAAQARGREGGAPQALMVAGNQVRAAAGRPVVLQGVNVPSLEWSTAGERVMDSTRHAIEKWKANVIRLPLSQDRWFGKEPGQSDKGAGYQKLVAEVVQHAAGKDAYVVLDLHWSNRGVWGKNMERHEMPDENSLEFWKDVAARYANHPAVLFDLYNEPRDVSWQVWRDGGVVESKDAKGTLSRYKTPGMQALLDGIRAAGARNVVIAEGLDWGYDLSGVLSGHGLKDNTGNLMYSTHIYPWKKDWEQKVGAVADRFPVLVGEVGCEPDAEQEDPYTWAPDVIAYIQKRKLHWTAWCFHHSCSPSMLQDQQYVPTPYWGAFVKAALLGAQFHSDRAR